MKNIYKIIICLFFVACTTTQAIQPSTSIEVKAKQNDLYRINDIWLLETINNDVITKAGDGNKTPQLEIHVKDNRVLGNDGCNQMSGGLKLLTETEITFGPIMGTRMICPEMETTTQFLKALERVTQYKIENLQLYLFDEHNQELLKFKKID